MYLKKLTLMKKDGELIREISFKLGLNLIIGQSDENGSSNSLGKTTLIRALNFCLAGKLDEFYIDNENKKVENIAVKDFLLKNQVIFELKLSKNFEYNDFYNLKITRQVIFNTETDKIEVLNFIDDNKYSLDEFKEVLKLRLFLANVQKPTFRQLITKFVRRNDDEVTHILKYLGNFISPIDYTTIRFFLFGFKDPQIIEKKQILDKEYKALSKKHSSLKAIIPEGLQQKIDLLQAELLEKESLRDSFQIEKEYKVDENQLSKIELNLNKLTKKIVNLTSDKDVLVERIQTIYNNTFIDNPQDIKYIYEEAKLLNIEIQSKFEDTINFHNTMLKNEERYLQKRINKLNNSIQILSSERKDLTELYNSLLVKLSKQGALAEFTQLNEQINKLTATLSTDKALLQQLGELVKEQNTVKLQLDNLSDELSSNIDDFNKVNIHIFNTYFSKYSEKLHNEKWYVSFDKDGSTYKFDVKAFESNAGSGKKQSLVAAFDIAYMSFIQDPKINLPFPCFATQDKVEIIDINELEELSELVLKANGQLITPMIQDKFKSFNETDFSENVILELSPSNKFFNF